MQPVGFWAVEVTPEQDLIKWGKDGDVEFPYPTYKDALELIRFLQEEREEQTSAYYILVVFPNGCIRTDEILDPGITGQDQKSYSDDV